MIARSFLSAADLHLTEAEHAALVEVLNRMERGELRHISVSSVSYGGSSEPNTFNMSAYHCGTCHCIVGWAEEIIGHRFAADTMRTLCQLGSPDPVDFQKGLHYDDITVAEAAEALRNYLTTGDALWADVLAGA